MLVVSLPSVHHRLVVDGSRDATLRKEVIVMLLIEGAEYRQCGYCLSWRPADELVWNDERLDWICYGASCVSALVV